MQAIENREERIEIRVNTKKIEENIEQEKL